jgi:hypothetical protein
MGFHFGFYAASLSLHDEVRRGIHLLHRDSLHLLIGFFYYSLLDFRRVYSLIKFALLFSENKSCLILIEKASFEQILGFFVVFQLYEMLIVN